MAISIFRSHENIETAIKSIDLTQAALFKYSRLTNDYPELGLKDQSVKFQQEFDELNKKLGDSFGPTSFSLLRTVLFWRKSASIHDARVRMEKLKGRIVCASADVETKCHCYIHEVRNAYKEQLDRDLLELYEKRGAKMSLTDFIGKIARPAAESVLKPEDADLYVMMFSYRLQKLNKDTNAKSNNQAPEQGGSGSEARSSSVPDNPTQKTLELPAASH